ncbi:MAG: CDGSH iron-sulfur domain-containing protein [Bacteroidales bacterium]
MNSKEIDTRDTGSKPAPETFYIKITPDGPYVVYGAPPLDQEIIVPNEDGNSWVYQKGEHFKPAGEPYHLCRCGASKHKPYCDGSHKNADWNPKETAAFVNILDESEWYDGPEAMLSDDQKLCAYARFCDAYGRIWNLVGETENEDARKIFFHEAGHCPAGRLIGWDKKTGKAFEPKFEPSIGLIQDPQIKVSGPIWVKGGIRIESADGKSYEIRNRVTLCRCGQSSNKPFCDGTHASCHWVDDLPMEGTGEKW